MGDGETIEVDGDMSLSETVLDLQVDKQSLVAQVPMETDHPQSVHGVAHTHLAHTCK